MVQTRQVLVDASQRRYALQLPPEYDSSRRWPLIVFLHGWGERGDDGLLPAKVGLGPALRAHPERFPAVAIFPQMPLSAWDDDTMDAYWAYIDGTKTTEKLDDVVVAMMADYPTEHIDAAVKDAMASFSVDPDRVYLTGLSMGGFGAFHYAAQHPDRFAAVLSVCGGGDTRTAPKIAYLPIRVHHGGADRTVAPKMSRRMVEALRQQGAKVTYVKYPGVDHNSWDRTYGDADVATWLLAQQR